MLPAGAQLGPYRIVGLLGTGGMGEVYTATDTRLGRTVAVKVLQRWLAESAAHRERFEREARLISQLNHPHICTLHDVGNDQGAHYLVMEHVDGETLESRLRQGALSPDETIAYASQIADALNAAHRRGIVHRDLKPANIMLTRSGVKVLDFGLAKLSAEHAAARGEERAGSDLTEQGTILGTTQYMAPEQLEGKEADARTDIFAFGAIVYEMLTGKRAFEGGSKASLIAAILKETPRQISAIQPSVAPGLESTIMRCLAKEADDRWQNAGDLLFQLRADSAATSKVASAVGAAHMASAMSRRPRWLMPASALVLAGAVGAGGFWLLTRDVDGRWFQQIAIPQIESNIAVGDWAAAFEITAEAQARLGDSPELEEIWPRLSWTTTIDSEPRGAAVYLRPYASDENAWKELGRTPLENIRIPFGLSRVKLELDGYLPLTRTLGGGLAGKALRPRGDSIDGIVVGTDLYRLDTNGTLPEGKVRVPGWTELIDGAPVMFADYFLDRTEVTNAQFKAFVDAGGYEKPELWDPVVRDGEVVPWAEAMQLFQDRTGRRGPSTWEAGSFKRGEEDFPVAGVSWYEAAAFARYRGQELPTAYHWRRARAQGEVPWLMAASNLASAGPRAVTESTAMSFVGAYDLAGNQREWTASPAGDGRIIAGGSWDDQPYVAFQSLTARALPLDRSPANGFRLAIMRDSADVRERSFAALLVTNAPQDRPIVSDETYAAYASFFDYERAPLNAAIESEDRTRLWTRQRITFDSPYDDSREVLYLYLPTAGSPPYQTVVYWPTGGAYVLDSVDADSLPVDFIVQSGRALAFPVYPGTYERRNERGPPFAPRSQIAYRDNITEGVIDLRRSLDYLETRPDIDTSAFGYFGMSQGGVTAPIVLSHEPRLRVAVSYVGFIPAPPPPAVIEPAADTLQALPRVNVPVLLLSGEFDSTAPIENARRYFALLGTPDADKKHVVAPAGHFVPRDLLVRETLDWLDRYLGSPR